MSWNNVKSSVQNSIKQNGAGAISGNLLQGVLLTICNEAEVGIGPQGKSAYQAWLDEGNVGTVSDFFASLKGEMGDHVALRKTTGGIEWKLSSQPDTDYRLLVTIEELKLHFSDLTTADIAALQQPATDAAAALTVYVQQQEAVLTQLQQATESARQDAADAAANASQVTTAATMATTAAGQATAGATTAAEAANQAAATATQSATAALTATDEANAAATSANDAAGAADAAAMAANQAEQSATDAAAKAEELNANPPKIANGVWWAYDLATHSYVNTGLPARGPEGKGPVVLENGNYGNWDDVSQTYLDSGILAAATIDLEYLPVYFTEATVRENIQAGEAVPTVFGKVKKWFADLGALAWKAKVNYTTDIDNLPVIPEAQIPSDWNQTDEGKKDVIRNKPSFKTIFGQLLTGIGDITPKLVKDVSFHEATRSLTFSFSDGSENKTVPIPADHFLSGASYQAAGHMLTLQLSGGSSIEVSLEELADEYKAAAGGGIELVNGNEFRIVDDVWTAIHRVPIHKSVVLQPTGWTAGELWSYTITDTDITDGCLIDFAPDNASYDVYADAAIRPVAGASAGSMTLYAENRPDDSMNLLYTIVK